MRNDLTQNWKQSNLLNWKQDADVYVVAEGSAVYCFMEGLDVSVIGVTYQEEVDVWDLQ